MLSSSSQFDVGQTKKRIRSDVARRRSRLLKGHGGDRPRAASGEAERPFTEVLQFCLAAKRSQTEKLRSVIETAREETVVNRWIPKVLRQFFRRQGGFNRSVIKALDTVLTGLGTLGSEQSEARAYLNAQYYWLRDFADRQEQMGKSLEELVHRVAKKEEDFYTLEVENGRLVESVAHLRRFAGVLLTNLDREAETARQMKAAMSDLLNGLDQEVACRKEQETRLESITAQLEGLARATQQESQTRDASVVELGERMGRELAAAMAEQTNSRASDISKVSVEFNERSLAIKDALDDVRRIAGENQARVDKLEGKATEQLSTETGLQAELKRLHEYFSRLEDRQLNDSAYLKGAVLVQQQLLYDRLDFKKPAPGEAKGRLSKSLDHSFDALYVAFEDRFRGSRSQIKSRFEFYLPYLAALGTAKAKTRVLDVGCGRGEWLELLRESGFSKLTGVDSNTVMAAQCRERGLSVVVQDCLDYLASLKKESLALITAFHVIEHLPFEQQMRFLTECYRTLSSKGLIIFETPNPDNLIVAAKNFYTDPTHLRPIPSGLAAFLTEQAGFAKVDVVPQHPFGTGVLLREDGELAARFNELFYSDQDYAIIARKS